MSEPYPSEKAYGHGLVLGKFYPFHAGHQALIRAALRACDRVTVALLGSQVETIPLEVRAEWLREEHPTAHVVAAMDEARVDFDDPAACTGTDEEIMACFRRSRDEIQRWIDETLIGEKQEA